LWFSIFIFMKRISILGSTGSIGRSTLSVVEAYPERFQVVALAAGRNVDVAFEQALRWKPRLVSVAGEEDAEILRNRLKASQLDAVEVVHGSAGTVQVATHPEANFVVSAIVGVAGLEATYEAVRSGRQWALRTKSVW
jgi:1-deoxy-D-xylulose-5-phosphate reductoisomerase